MSPFKYATAWLLPRRVQNVTASKIHWCRSHLMVRRHCYIPATFAGACDGAGAAASQRRCYSSSSTPLQQSRQSSQRGRGLLFGNVSWRPRCRLLPTPVPGQGAQRVRLALLLPDGRAPLNWWQIACDKRTARASPSIQLLATSIRSNIGVHLESQAGTRLRINHHCHPQIDQADCGLDTDTCSTVQVHEQEGGAQCWQQLRSSGTNIRLSRGACVSTWGRT